MKILSIGNSFSDDAQRWLFEIANSDNYNLTCANLYIGGCSLETHYNNILKNKADYLYSVNGQTGDEYVSIKDALHREKWDVVTVQQASGKSGVLSTYLPYITEIVDYVKSNLTDVSLYIHQTWGYETDSTHENFSVYKRDRDLMAKCIIDNYKKVSSVLNLPLIPVGEAVNAVRKEIREFDYENGGISLTRDGFHLNELYGCFLAGATWYMTLTGNDIRKVDFLPFADGETADKDLIEKIKDKVYKICK